MKICLFALLVAFLPAAAARADAVYKRGVGDAEASVERCERVGGITAPNNSDRLVPGLPVAATIVRARCIIGGSGSIQLDVEECSATGTLCTAAGISLSCDADGAEDTAFTDAVFAADAVWNFNTAAAVGTVDYISWEVCGKW